jgi:hypothetical protein
MSRLKLLVAAVTACVLLCSSAWAQNITDPATLHINGGTAFIFGNEVHAIGNTFTITQNSGGAANLDPVLLIIGVVNTTSIPNHTAFNSSSITNVVFSSGATPTVTLGGTNVFGSGQTWSSTTGFTGIDMSSSDAYTLLNLGGKTNNSNSLGNWSAADSAVNGITATSFSLYVFQLSDSGNALPASSAIFVTFGSGTLATGDFAIAFGQDSKGKPFSTPFTESGLDNGSNAPPGPVPAPPSAILFGMGGFGIALFWFNRRPQPAAA